MVAVQRHRNTWILGLRALFVLVTAAGALAIGRHLRHLSRGHSAPGGVLMRDSGAYDSFSRRMLGSFFDQIAADIARAVQPNARVLEIGCGPGHLSMRMAQRHGLDVTAIDLDPAMIEQARANASRADGGGASPSFGVGDVARLPYPDGSFDLVVSTLSMHHWTDPAAGLAEIDRVLGPGGRALIWDLRHGVWRFHRHLPDPADHAQGSTLRVVRTMPWRWPWRLTLTQRFELARPGDRPVIATETEPPDSR